MIFLHPFALLGLAAAAIPALLHLLARRDPPELEFPPLRYLTEAERRSARRLKLRHLLLLALRTTLVVTIVMAAARPLVPASGGGAHEPTALVVVLDNSASSGVVAEGRPALDRLRAVAAASIAQATSADRIWLVLADGVIRSGSREELLAIVDSVTPEYRRLDVTEATGRAVRLANAEPTAAREVHVLSDLQRTALGDRPVEVPGGVRVLALAPGAGAAANRGIGMARVIDGAVRLAVVGTAGSGAGAVWVRLGSDSRELGRALAAPGDEAAVPLPVLRPGWRLGQVEVEPDELRLDDRRVFVWRVAPPARVGSAPTAGPFVLAALDVLREAGRVTDGIEVVIAEQPGPGVSVVLPPADAALLGPANRALAGRGATWRFAVGGPPGGLAAPEFPSLEGIAVTRRYRLERAGPDTGAVIARVNGEPWLVRDGDLVLVASRLDTGWTALPATPQFVPFVDALVNRIARGEAAITEAEGPTGVTFDVRGTDTVGATVFGLDPREADLAPAADRLARRMLGAELRDDAAFARERFAGTRRADASGALLVLALFLAAVELVVAARTR